MRIVGGEFRGRTLAIPDDARVRPTAERVREAWMNILQEALPGSRVLDLYAGSGALGLEALSRGAATADFVEVAPASLAALRRNIGALGLEGRATLHRGDALRYAARLAPASYDIALADPPYTRDDAARLVALFRQAPFARILAVEHPARTALAGDETRRYGDVAITFCYAP
ncbi:MAG TPA: 16S rRNA (guanine(966)-N(2))-methyltransferase RsmD [Gemmatimonadales bacterium]|nr:16S rRNA (guanine(966)-N(2))-methyltransferase RsmD [Gemmatimonadales bacterium]